MIPSAWYRRDLMKSRLDPHNSTCCLMSQLNHTIEQEIATSLSDMNLTVLQLEVLAELSMDPSRTTADLARLTFVTPQNMSLTVSKLADRGYLVRAAHATNARINRLELTPVGRRVLDRALARAKQVEARTFAVLTSRERAGLLDSLRRSLSPFKEAQMKKSLPADGTRANRNVKR
jgi:DNA-binding MarR family transcriptional regulator